VCWAIVSVFSFAGDCVWRFVSVDLFDGVFRSGFDGFLDFQVCGGFDEAFRDGCGLLACVDRFGLPVHSSGNPVAT
jgi:hypothetical protein